MVYSQQLPAPGTLINMAGQLDNVTGMPAPGFAGLGMKSNYDVKTLRSRSNRGLPVNEGGHFWSFTINYHPMTRDTFDALESFILGMDTRAIPFYVGLPNYSSSRNTAFNNWDASNNATIQGTAYAGDNMITINIGADIPYPGDLFNVVDSSNALHKNIYKVNRVETNTSYSGAQPTAGTARLTIFPPLQRDKIGTATLVFQNPLFRVIQKGDHEYSIDENNLFQINLNVEEIMP